MVGSTSRSIRWKYRISTPMPIASTDAIIRPENTRPVVAPRVISTASNGDGPLFIAVPMLQRVAVLKNFAWSAIDPINTCGGGSSFASAQPNHQNSSQIPANNPTDRQVQKNFSAVRHSAPLSNIRPITVGKDQPGTVAPAGSIPPGLIAPASTASIRRPICT